MLRLFALLMLSALPAQAACGPDPLPGGAAGAALTAVGFTCETFWDGPFTLATIDVNNTKGAAWSPANPSGFKWYVDFNWPRAVGSGWVTLGLTPPGDLSIVSGNKLLIAPQGVTITSGHAGMVTTCGQLAAPPYYQGKTFTDGYYYEVLATWPNGGAHGPSCPNANPSLCEGSWPNAWTWPTSYLTPGFVTNTTTELDNIEAPFGRNLHVWTNTGGVSTDHASNCSACGASTTGVKYGVLLVPSGLNAGTAKMDYYANDVFQATSTPPSGYTSSIFDFSADEDHCLILGAAQANPMTVTSVRVWQQPSATGGPPAAGRVRLW